MTETKKKPWRPWQERHVDKIPQWAMLQCLKCFEYKSTDSFYITRWRYFSYCKTCNSGSYKTYRKRKTTVSDENGRECPVCHEYKPRCEFWNNVRWPNGKTYRCKVCLSKLGKEQYARLNKRLADSRKKSANIEDKRYLPKYEPTNIDEIIDYEPIVHNEEEFSW